MPRRAMVVGGLVLLFGTGLRPAPLWPAEQAGDEGRTQSQEQPAPISVVVFDFGVPEGMSPEVGRQVAEEMGAIPAAVLAMPGRVRGTHPLMSFSAVGPRAAELVSPQTPMDGLAPIERLAGEGGEMTRRRSDESSWRPLSGKCPFQAVPSR